MKFAMMQTVIDHEFRHHIVKVALAEQEQFNLPDCEYEGMFKFLHFLYTEKVYLSGMKIIANFVSGREAHSSSPHQEMQ